jgi:hypothetical protein
MTETKTVPEPGIYYDLSFEDYVQIDAINNTILKMFRERTPMHARYYQLHGRETQCLAFGRLAHVMLLEPDKVDQLYAIGPDVRRNANAWKEFADTAEADGKTPIKRAEYDEALAIANAVKAQRVYGLIRRGHSEVTLVWDDKETGLRCKARLDYEHKEEAILIDMKGLTDASPQHFNEKDGYNFGYFQQAAMSSEGWEVLTGRTPAFTFLLVEKCPSGCDPLFWPYPTVASETQPNTMLAGKITWHDCLRRYAKCLKDDYWPGYVDEREVDRLVVDFELPDWCLKRLGINQYNMGADYA